MRAKEALRRDLVVLREGGEVLWRGSCRVGRNANRATGLGQSRMKTAKKLRARRATGEGKPSARR